MPTPDTNFRDRVAALTKGIADQGFIVRAGWVGYRQYVMAPDAPDIQVQECKMAFYAGAQHLFASIMDSLDPDKEPTEADMRRMDLIHKELQDFGHSFIDKAMPPKGHG